MKIRDWFKFVLFSVTPHLVFDEMTTPPSAEVSAGL